MTMTNQRIEEFIEEHSICVGDFGITTEPHRCTNTSKVWGGHAYETKLTREGVEGYEWMYTFSGKGIWEQSLADALCFAIEEAEHGGCYESYERWHQEYDYDYLFEDEYDYFSKDEEDYEKGQEMQKNWYEACKDYYDKLMKILGQELYEKLADIITEGWPCNNLLILPSLRMAI